MANLKQFFVDNWKSKLISLFIAISIWYLIKSHLDAGRQDFPVPGTNTPIPLRPATGPVLDDTLLGPLIPPPPLVPVPIPVPGGDVRG
jgi:hypothetical protein